MDSPVDRAAEVLALGRAAAARLWLRLGAEGHQAGPGDSDRAALTERVAEIPTLAARVLTSWPRAGRGPLARIARWLDGDPAQLVLLALAVAPLLDGALARSLDALAPRGGTTLGLLLDLAEPDQAARLALAARLGGDRGLVGLGLLEIEPTLGLAATAPVRVPAAVLAAVRGGPIPTPTAVADSTPPGAAPTLEPATIGLPDLARPLLVVGPSPWSLHTIGRVLAARDGAALWTCALPSDASLDLGWTRLVRDAALAGAVPAFDLAPEREPDPLVIARRLGAAVHAARRLDAAILLYAPDEDPVPTPLAQALAVVSMLRLAPGAGTLLAQARLEQDGVADAAAITARAIAPLAPAIGQVEALVDAHHRGTLEDPSPAAQAAIADALRPRLGNLVERVARRVGWDALILPAETTTRLQEMVLYRRHAERVYREWGLGKHVTGEGIAALFSGPPGTGKTLAASVIATELGIALYRVDLSQIVSKWVGETEKNLARLFAEARHGHAVLLFDEADSLFGKRTEVKSANDRYANLEVNFLLQKLDHFDGIAILTTNALVGIDEAFLRRLQFRVDFDTPDADARAALWRRHLPDPRHLHADLDLDDIAERWEFSGGNIRNAAIRAAFLAAEDGGALHHHHLKQACAVESEELGRVVKR
ncbi:MAG: ATP-binding protein [Myxococcales bacterium]|nr:ATP-binding protein [Myxococcales bacterium]